MYLARLWASLNEVLLAEKGGLAPDMVYYSAPGKTERDIMGALGKCVITADSLNEIALIEKTAGEMGVKAEIGVRINPDFSFYGGKGGPSKFGIEEYQLFDRAEYFKGLKNIKITGLHVHLHSQELNTDCINMYYKNMFSLINRTVEKLGIDLKFVNLGSGIGIPYAREDCEVNVEALGKNLSKMVEDFKSSMPLVSVFVETGRYCVGKSGLYAAKVLDKKVSFGKTYVILANTLNGFMRPAMAHILEKYTDDEKPAESEPFYTCKGAFQYIPLNNNTETEKVTLCGNLCTSTDIMEEDIELAKLEVGDTLVITNAGSYAAVITPMQFASLNPPVQLMLKSDGSVTCADK